MEAQGMVDMSFVLEITIFGFNGLLLGISSIFHVSNIRIYKKKTIGSTHSFTHWYGPVSEYAVSGQSYALLTNRD